MRSIFNSFRKLICSFRRFPCPSFGCGCAYSCRFGDFTGDQSSGTTVDESEQKSDHNEEETSESSGETAEVDSLKAE